MSCGKVKVGYAGQRYEVRALREDGSEFVIGWLNNPTGGSLVEMVELHPSWHSPKVIDLRPQRAIVDEAMGGRLP